MSRRVVLPLLVLALLAGGSSLANAHPSLWAVGTKTCIAHPAMGSLNGGHAAVGVDSATTISVLDSNDATITAVCPGATYTIKAKLPAPREVMATVTAGTISDAKDCSNRWVSEDGARTPALSLPWKVPCTLPAGSSVVKITSASGADAQLMMAQLTLPVQPTCIAPSCAPAKKAAPTPQPVVATKGAAANATTAATNATTAATNATKAAGEDGSAAAATAAAAAAATAGGIATKSVPATAQASQGGQGSSCAPSSLGYRCAVDLPQGGRLHYSKGGALPQNPCTKGTQNNLPGVDAAQMLHFAVESPLPGYVGLGFTTRPNKMYPSDVVIGTMDTQINTPTMQTFTLQSYTLDAARDRNVGWTTNQGIVRSSNGSPLMCFSRPITAINAKATSNLTPSNVNLIYAMSPGTAFKEHTKQGGVSINMDTGVSTTSSDGRDQTLYGTVHGVLMLLAFVVLMPLAVLLARHKWLFGSKKTSTIKPYWFKMHIYMQMLAVAAAVTSIILIFVAKGWEAGSHKLFDSHKVLGMIITALSVVQIGLGMVRPDLKSPTRGVWRLAHYTVGYTTMLVGIANCFLGLVMIHDLRGQPLLAWLVPTVVLSGIWLLAALALEVEKVKLEKNKQYNPKSHVYAPGHGKILPSVHMEADQGMVVQSSSSNPGTPTHRRGVVGSQL